MRRRFWMGGVVGLLSLAACGGGDSGSAALRGPAPTVSTAPTTAPTVPSAAPTTVREASPTTASRGNQQTPVTTAPRATTTVPAPGSATLAVSPGTAPVGTRVRLEGSGFTGEMYRASGAQLWLSGPHPEPGCNFFAQAEHTLVVSADGRISGDFVVPARGECRQGSVGDLPITSGRYEILYPCTACHLGSIEVVAPQCDDVVFTPNSENAAWDIVATGMSCAEAEAFVRKVGGPMGPINGLPRVESDGFTCVRTSRSDRGLPSATYECTNGNKRITFVRT